VWVAPQRAYRVTIELERFVRQPLEQLILHTITTPRALRRELDRVRRRG
jgi:DNA-binding IclR family transcriptional regulator